MPDQDLAKQRRFLLQVEQGVRLANTEIIHQRIPHLSTESILPFAVSVARLRARYLEAAFRFSEKEHGDPLDEPEIDALRRTREMYEEARDAFDALLHAIERGYVDIAE